MHSNTRRRCPIEVAANGGPPVIPPGAPSRNVKLPRGLWVQHTLLVRESFLAPFSLREKTRNFLAVCASENVIVRGSGREPGRCPND